MRLFGTFTRTDSSLPGPGVNPFEWLDGSNLTDATNIRNLIEEWFAAYPIDEQQELKNRFQNERYSHHLGAWWELYVFTLYRKLDFCVEIHPSVQGAKGRPDFLVTKEDTSYYVECTVVSPIEHNGERDEPRARWIHDALSALTGKNFHLGVSIEKLGQQLPSVSKVVTQLNRWLGELDTNRGVGAVETLLLTPKDWELTVRAYPVSAANSEGGRFLGVLPPDQLVAINDVAVIRDKVEQKGRRYGQQPGKPLIVALVSTTTYTNDDDISTALFGGLENISDRSEVVTIARRTNGYWRPSPNARGGRVSGVLFGERLYHWTVASALPKLWLNPCANEPLTLTDPFTVLTTAPDASGEVLEIPGRGCPSIFGLPPAWPC